MNVADLRPLAVGDLVAHREDQYPPFAGIVIERLGNEYDVQWDDGEHEIYRRGDLVAINDPDTT